MARESTVPFLRAFPKFQTDSKTGMCPDSFSPNRLRLFIEKRLLLVRLFSLRLCSQFRESHRDHFAYGPLKLAKGTTLGKVCEVFEDQFFVLNTDVHWTEEIINTTNEVLASIHNGILKPVTSQNGEEVEKNVYLVPSTKLQDPEAEIVPDWRFETRFSIDVPFTSKSHFDYLSLKMIAIQLYPDRWDWKSTKSKQAGQFLRCYTDQPDFIFRSIDFEKMTFPQFLEYYKQPLYLLRKVRGTMMTVKSSVVAALRNGMSEMPMQSAEMLADFLSKNAGPFLPINFVCNMLCYVTQETRKTEDYSFFPMCQTPEKYVAKLVEEENLSQMQARGYLRNFGLFCPYEFAIPEKLANTIDQDIAYQRKQIPHPPPRFKPSMRLIYASEKFRWLEEEGEPGSSDTEEEDDEKVMSSKEVLRTLKADLNKGSAIGQEEFVFEVKTVVSEPIREKCSICSVVDKLEAGFTKVLCKGRPPCEMAMHKSCLMKAMAGQNLKSKRDLKEAICPTDGCEAPLDRITDLHADGSEAKPLLCNQSTKEKAREPKRKDSKSRKSKRNEDKKKRNRLDFSIEKNSSPNEKMDQLENDVVVENEPELEPEVESEPEPEPKILITNPDEAGLKTVRLEKKVDEVVEKWAKGGGNRKAIYVRDKKEPKTSMNELLGFYHGPSKQEENETPTKLPAKRSANIPTQRR
ncbi:unnamed protein product [Caenorhabditis auriculariae]|uniref:Uncharacterized protein n=1 Tax=Caenorhabditis auriculariae TaxID=2777116 RepID=A0A8S1H3U1_9PELO|nr:unnamed protein product [Caenorhabditis auriculariae]